jgi:Tfp pilus assembly protein PilZ
MLSDLRRYPRYFLPAGLHAQLEQAEANVVDLSIKGARVQVNQAFGVGTKVKFVLAAANAAIQTNATVLWCQIAALALDDDESDVYLAGVTFEEAIPEVESVLNQMIAKDEAIAIEDSRSTERYSVTIPLHGSFGEDAADVRILDLSIRGARICGRKPIRVGESISLRFRLEPGPAVDVTAKVAWCQPSERKLGFEAGLSIADEEALMRAVVAQMCMRKQAKVDMNSLRRKFNPLRSGPRSGMLALAS